MSTQPDHAHIDEATAWVDRFVRWFNTRHLHSGINFVTPGDRYAGRDQQVLEHRRAVYEQARRRRPERWTGTTRDRSPTGPVLLNPNPAVPATKLAA